MPTRLETLLFFRKGRVMRNSCFLAIWLLLTPVQAMAQSIACSDSDYECLQETIVASCHAEQASLESCTRLLGVLRSHEHSEALTWKLAIASNYLALSEFPDFRVSEGDALSQEKRAQYNQEAATYITDVLREEPGNVEALLGLSALSDDRSAQIEYLRRATIADPANTFVSRGLVNRLLASGTEEEVEEAANTLLNTFRATPPGTTKWHIARSLVGIYRTFDREGQFNDFVDELSLSINLDKFVTSPTDAVSAQTSLPLTYCDSSLVSILGASYCLSSIDHLIELASRESERRDLIENASNAVILAGQSDDLRAANVDWSAVLLERVAQLMSFNEPVAALYEAHANLVSGDEKTRALQKAIEYAPDNGQYYYRLGLIHHAGENWDDAARLLLQARERLPESRYKILDQYLNEALEKLSQ